MSRVKEFLRRISTPSGCPSCGSASTMMTTDGRQICMDCQYQW